MKLYHIVYKNGRLIKKIVESDKKILNKIYEQNLSIILDERH